MLVKLSSVRIMSDASFATSVPAIPYKKLIGIIMAIYFLTKVEYSYVR